jgi:hypothetical protein
MPKQLTNAHVTGFSSLFTPMHAAINGDPVRVIAYGDVEGWSAWYPLTDSQITDTNALPLAMQPALAR